MNDRILELSFEAQRYALDNTTGPDLASLNELWQEKFAELLIRECIRLCDQVDVVGADECIDNIREHFEIK